LFDDGIAGGEQDEHLVLVLEAVHQFKRLGARFREPGGFLIGALHGSGGVKNDHAQAAGGGVPGEVGAAQGQDGQDQQEQLQEQEPVVAEPLKGGVGLGVGQKL